MKPTGRLAALAFALSVALVGCTGENGNDGDGQPTADTGPQGPTETISVPAGSNVYRYANAGLVVTLDLDEGSFEVDNGTGHGLPKPDFYVLDANDGARVEGKVVDAAPIPAGETATFEAVLSGIELDQIGLVILLMGGDNYGAFVHL